MFDQLGGIDKLVRNKTVTIKLNMTGAPGNKLQGMALGRTHYAHPKVVGAVAYLMGKAGAKRIRFVESAWATGGRPRPAAFKAFHGNSRSAGDVTLAPWISIK